MHTCIHILLEVDGVVLVLYLAALQVDGFLEALVKTSIIEYCVVNDQEGHWENIATCANNENVFLSNM